MVECQHSYFLKHAALFSCAGVSTPLDGEGRLRCTMLLLWGPKYVNKSARALMPIAGQ